MLTIDLRGKIGALEIEARIPEARGITLIIGPNGSGKSTLLRMVLGMVPAVTGRVALNGIPIFDSDSGLNVPTEERQLGYVPQYYGLFPHMTVLANVCFGFGAVRPRIGASEKIARGRGLLEAFQIEHLAKRLPRQCSGGEAQRVALARALAREPKVLLLDEPMAALDLGARRQVRKWLAEHLAKISVPTLMVTHEVGDVAAFGGQIAVMERGRVIQLGTAQEIAASPASEFAEEFVAPSQISAAPGVNPG